MKDIQFSIIIPHKNTPELLQICLNSIPVRDDIQVIVVDDNSDPHIVDFDNFPKWEGINYEYYLTKKGKGAGYARNVGLKHATGKWLVFSDADDTYITPALEQLLDLPKNNYDIIFFPIQITHYDGKTEMLNLPTFGNQNGFDKKLLGRFSITDNYIEDITYRMFLPVAKIIKRDIILKHNIKYSEVPSCNDILFSLKAQSKCNHIGVFTDMVYHYIKRKGSTSDVIDKKRLRQRTRELMKVQHFLLKFNKQQYIEYTLKWHFDQLQFHCYHFAILYSLWQMIYVSPRIGLDTLKRIIHNKTV